MLATEHNIFKRSFHWSRYLLLPEQQIATECILLSIKYVKATDVSLCMKIKVLV